MKVSTVKEDLETKETNINEVKNADIGDDSEGNEELDDDEFEVDHILNVAAIDGEVRYQVRWKNYGSDEDSWEPEQNLETARLILDEYTATHQDEVKKAHDLVLAQSKLRKRPGSRTKLRNKGNKKLRRSLSSENLEVTKTINLRTRKKTKIEYGDDDKNDSDEDYEEVSKKRRRRGRRANGKMKRTKVVDLSKEDKEDKPLTKDLSPKKAKNAWLYDDAEDADSDISGASAKTKKKDIFLCKTKDNNELKENGTTEKSNVSLTVLEELREDNLDRKDVVLLNEKKQKGRGKVPAKVNIVEERMSKNQYSTSLLFT